MKKSRETGAEQQNNMILRMEPEGLTLVSGDQSLRGDFTRMLNRIRPDNLRREFLVKAAAIKGAGRPGESGDRDKGTRSAGRSGLTAVDATAGLGEDSLLLAAAGFSVSLYEYNPVIAALLRDALRRATDIPELAPAIGRMRLFEEDSLEALPRLTEKPDVILLDPMFPARRKSALVKKKLQMLQQLERPCEDEAALLDAAIAAGPRKVLIKRPPKGPYLAGQKPSYSIRGKAVRFDCIVVSSGG